MNQVSALWQVQMQGQASDLEHLARHFTSGPFRVLIDERDGCFLCESDLFVACKTPEDVLKRANDELCILSGVLHAVRDSPGPLRAGAVYRHNVAGGRNVFDFIQETACVRSELCEVAEMVRDADGSVITSPGSRTVTIAQLARTDIAVAKAMRLLASPDHRSWVGLYRIYEVIEDDVKSECALKRRGWGTEQDRNRFKHSANSVAVAGDFARHGKELGQLPKQPMSLEDADAYLKSLLQSWLSSKGV